MRPPTEDATVEGPGRSHIGGQKLVPREMRVQIDHSILRHCVAQSLRHAIALANCDDRFVPILIGKLTLVSFIKMNGN